MTHVKRVYRSELRAQQTEATRQRILEAAASLFARQGYQDVTMDQLAGQAGVAVQTLYAAFGSKLDLAAAVVRDTLARAGIPEQVERLGTISDAELALRTVARVNRLVDERLVDLLDLLDVTRLRESVAMGDRLRERDLAAALVTVAASPRRRPDLTEADMRDVLLALTAPMLFRTLVKDRGWTAERYEQWLGDLLVVALLR